MEDNLISQTLLKILDNVKLREGIDGLLKVLATIDRFPYLSLKKLSRESKLPVPICVAIRNEFQKVKWCYRDTSGTRITEKGKSVLLSFSKINQDFNCNCCDGLGITLSLNKYEKELQLVSKYSKLRGKPDTTIDQSFATPETSLSRVLFMNTKFDLFGKSYAFLGDGDLTSLALALFVSSATKITVFDIDDKLELILKRVNQELGLNIEFVKHDLRQPFLEKYKNNYDCIITDPPYTVNGCLLFISRSMTLLRDKKMSRIYLSFSSKTPREMSEIQQGIITMGGLITDILYGFNKYIGAQSIGGVSNLIRILTIPPLVPEITKEFGKPIYTGELNPKIRIYNCLNCNEQIEIGKGKLVLTIEDLKEKGCPKCEQAKFRKIAEKIIE